MSRILTGVVLSGAFSCFDEVNRLSPAVLSAVSTDIENIQNAILQKASGETSGSIKLADISIEIEKVSAFAGVFVT